MTKQRAFQRALLGWYRRHRRDLPWRQARDPYAILVSEFMLQQTQVGTVLPYYQDWLRRFPGFAALARASEREVLHAWQGLGYYSRARNLHTAAKIVVERHGGQFPKSIEQMEQLFGVGKYTAHAVATFAFDQSVAIVEANTSRVLSRLFDLRIPIDSTAGRNTLWSRATSLVPKKSAAQYNSALLDLGALVCLARKPKCGICPVRKFCRAKHPESLPIKRPRPETKYLIERHAFVASRDKLLLAQSANRWRGMWILPPLNLSSKRNGAIYKATFPFTNHRVTLQIFRHRERKIDNPRKCWFPFRKLDSIPIPSPHRRAIDALLGLNVSSLHAQH
ncbi:MAG TPA: A/G-specific adenine glycosylase [Chthoniobacterales bacterium]|nr:A/G-specific adenine glycosylase [Chthoniobacterales bacterium]